MKTLKIDIPKKIAIEIAKTLHFLYWDGESVSIELYDSTLRNLAVKDIIKTLEHYSRTKQKIFSIYLNDNKLYFSNGLSSGFEDNKLFNAGELIKTLINLKTLAKQSVHSIEPFYDCNIPEEIEGYLIIGLDIDYYRYEKIEEENIAMERYVGKHRTHYLKWIYSHNPDISIRYHFIYQDRSDLVDKYIWKNHKTKVSYILSETQAKDILESMEFSKTPIEISGRLISKKYQKAYLKYDT